MIILKKNDDFFTLSMGKNSTPIEESLINYLADNIQIENGVTFGQLFSIILKHHDEYSEFFNSYLGGVSLGDFISDFNGAPKKDNNPIEYLCIHWGTTYIFPDEIDKPIYIRTIAELMGFKYSDDTFNSGGYSIEFTPLNKLKNLPIKLIPDNRISDINTTRPYFTLSRNFTVLDVLVSIFNEITFMGNPSEREDALNKIKDRLKKSSSENKDKSISLEDVLKKLKIDPPKE